MSQVPECTTSSPPSKALMARVQLPSRQVPFAQKAKRKRISSQI